MLKNRDEAFTGPLAAHFYGIVEERHRMGFKFGEEERLLHELDRMSVEFDCQEGLPEELVRKFMEQKPNWHQGTQEHHVQAIRIFALYLLRHDIPAFLVDYTSVTDLHEDYKPYIFTHEEINRIFEHADHIRANGQQSHVFYPVLFRVRYACARKTVRFLTEEETEHLLSAPGQDSRKGRRDTALLCLLYDSAARVQELEDLRVKDIRLSVPAQISLTGKAHQSNAPYRGRCKSLLYPRLSETCRYKNYRNLRKGKC